MNPMFRTDTPHVVAPSQPTSDQTTVMLSIVVPVYRAERIVKELVVRLESTLESIEGSYEVILVDDGSPDESWEAIQSVVADRRCFQGIRLSRNFGQHAAITAGLTHSQGDWVIVMDCDLQDQPEEIPRLMEKAEQGFDIVFARRTERSDGLLRRMLSQAFFGLLGFLTDTQQDPSIGNFGIYRRKVIRSMLSMGDYVRFFPTMVQWVGFHRSEIDVKHGDRAEGKSTYSLGSLLTLALNVILTFSDKPLRLTVGFGLLVSGLAFVYAGVNVVWYFTGVISVLGFTSLIVSIWMFAGIIITVLGVLGLYIGKIFDQTKQRPVFIVDEHLTVHTPSSTRAGRPSQRSVAASRSASSDRVDSTTNASFS